MNRQEKPLPPLVLPRMNQTDQAYAGDLLGRKDLGDRLTGYLDRLREGAVLAIDAPWGEGKTWFGRNWAKHLQEQGHKVIFIDAFEQDYVEDPFLLITAEIIDVVESGKESKALLKTASVVMQAILPVGTKAMINLAGRLALGSADLSEDFLKAAEAAQKGAADTTSKWVEKKLKDHVQEKKSLQSFQTELAKFAATQDKPVVLFIDELDRCRPSFGVGLVERIKHFFDVPNLVFILLLNRDQLESAIRGVYGADTDATAYLGKFVNFFFRLPKRTSIGLIRNDHVKQYVSHIIERYNFECDYHLFKQKMSVMATAFNLSLRDIERAIALYAFSQPHTLLNHYLAYLITLKISKPQLFQRLINNEKMAHMEAKKIIDELIQEFSRINQLDDDLIKFSEWHEAHIKDFKDVGENIGRIFNGLYQYNISQNELFTFLASRIDLPIE